MLPVVPKFQDFRQLFWKKKKKTIFSVEVIFGEVEVYDNVCIRALVYLTECMRNEHHHICQSERENLNIDF